MGSSKKTTQVALRDIKWMWWQWVTQTHHPETHIATQIKSKYNQLTNLSTRPFLERSQYVNETSTLWEHCLSFYIIFMTMLSYSSWCFPWKLKLLLYSRRSGPEGSSVTEGNTPQHRDESQQLRGRWGQEGGQATTPVESRCIEGLSVANQRGLWSDGWIWRDSSR